MSRTVVAKDLVVAQARALKMPGLARVLESLARQAREEHDGVSFSPVPPTWSDR